MCLFYNSHSFFQIASIKFYSFLFLVCTIRCGSFQFFTIYLFIFLSYLLIQVLTAYDFSQATTRKCNIGLAINAKSFTVSCTNSITAKNCTLHESFTYIHLQMQVAWNIAAFYANFTTWNYIDLCSGCQTSGNSIWGLPILEFNFNIVYMKISKTNIFQMYRTSK